MTARRRIPRAYLPFALLTMFGPLPIMLLQHDPIHVRWGGVLIVALLLWWIARGSIVSWTLVLLWNAFLLFSSLAFLGGGMTIGAPLLMGLTLVTLILQLRPSMRALVGFSGREPAGRPA